MPLLAVDKVMNIFWRIVLYSLPFNSPFFSDMVSFCDPVMSVVCACVCAFVRPSTILLINCKAINCKFDETLLECPLHEALPKLFKEFHSMRNSGYHGNKRKIFKILLLNNHKARA